MNTLQIVEQILAERLRQAEVEGYSPGDDDMHDRGELARLAAAYSVQAARDQFPEDDAGRAVLDSRARLLLPPGFGHNPKHPPRRRLVIAAALIVAEIERLDRAPATVGAADSGASGQGALAL